MVKRLPEISLTDLANATLPSRIIEAIGQMPITLQEMTAAQQSK